MTLGGRGKGDESTLDISGVGVCQGGSGSSWVKIMEWGTINEEVLLRIKACKLDSGQKRFGYDKT